MEGVWCSFLHYLNPNCIADVLAIILLLSLVEAYLRGMVAKAKKESFSPNRHDGNLFYEH